MTTAPPAHDQDLGRPALPALAVGVVALLLGLGAAFLDPAPVLRAYLAAYVFFLGIALGCLVILMVYHLTGGAWGFLIRRVLEAGTRTLPVLTVLFLPIGLCLGYLYLWARPEEVAADPDLQHKHVYLNVPFFWVRALIYFAAWNLLAFSLSALSRRQDRTGEPRLVPYLSRVSGPGLALYGITITFASVDWVMSIQPAFRSTIFGPLVVSCQLLSAQAFVLIILSRLSPRPPLAGAVSHDALNDLGNLLFTYLILWAYLVFFQFMLVWIANLRYDVLWYTARSSGPWLAVTWALFLMSFALPFFLLLLRDVKRDPRALGRVAGLLLFMQLVFAYYLVLPSFGETPLAEHWVDFLPPLGIGGVWLATFLWQLGRAPLLPSHDANEKSAGHLRRQDEESAALEELLHHA